MADWRRPFRSSWRWVRVSRETGYEVGALGNLTDGELTINADTKTFESASVDCVGPLEVGSDFVRCYLDAEWRDGTAESVCIGTWLASVPSRDVHGSYDTCKVRFDGRLMELEQDYFEGYLTVPASADPIAYARGICEGAGLEVVLADAYSGGALGTDWRFGLSGSGGDGGSKLAAVNALLGMAGFRAAQTDPMGRVVFRAAERQPYGAPVWTFEEGPEATFLADATDEFDATSVANRVVAQFETSEATVFGVAVDDDPSSPWSTVSLGRTVTKPYDYDYAATQAEADAKAEELLRTQQSVVRRVKLRHVRCPLRVGDVAEVDYPSAAIGGRFLARAQSVELGGAGCMTTTELRRFERA